MTEHTQEGLENIQVANVTFPGGLNISSVRAETFLIVTNEAWAPMSAQPIIEGATLLSI